MHVLTGLELCGPAKCQDEMYVLYPRAPRQCHLRRYVPSAYSSLRDYVSSLRELVTEQFRDGCRELVQIEWLPQQQSGTFSVNLWPNAGELAVGTHQDDRGLLIPRQGSAGFDKLEAVQP